jgi:hypothetical protein
MRIRSTFMSGDVEGVRGSRMTPITFSCEETLFLAPEEIARQILDLSKWPEFHGYGPIPGIRTAAFAVHTPGVVGTRIRVIRSYPSRRKRTRHDRLLDLSRLQLHQRGRRVRDAQLNDTCVCQRSVDQSRQHVPQPYSVRAVDLLADSAFWAGA